MSWCRSSRRDEEIDIHFVGLRGREYSSPKIFGDEVWMVFNRAASYLAFGIPLEDSGNDRAVFWQISSPKFQQLARFEAWQVEKRN
jgi:hypothetical protein